MPAPDTTQPLGKLNPENATLAWEQLSARVDGLIAAWQSGPRPPALEKFVPAEPPDLRRMMLVELIKVDLEYRWQQFAIPKRVEEYLAEFAELAQPGQLPCDLIYEEYLIRRQTAEPPDAADYLRRFPAQAEQLRRMFDLHPEAEATTTLALGARRPPIDVGERIDDFDILLRLGEGAFASVYLARQRSMQRLVALKISRDHGSEPQTLAALHHPNIVRVYDQRVLPDRRVRLLYMQHVPGGTLQGVLQLSRTMPPALLSGKTILQAIDAALEKHGESPREDSSFRRRLAAATWSEGICWLGARLAAALDYAHHLGVLHRDVKPANVLLGADGAPQLADFNVSFSSKLDGSTPAAYFGGSMAYMSPEQLEASNPDHDRRPDELDGRSDVYSLAVMLWELLAGTRPFGNEMVAANMTETLKQLAQRRRSGVPTAAAAALPEDLPGGLRDVLLGALAPEPAGRPATAGVLARQLQVCLQPRAQKMFRPRAGSLRQWMRRSPVACLIIAGVLPHLVVSIFNTFFNIDAFVSALTGHAKDIFYQFMVPVVNGVAYSGGIGWCIALSWPVLKAVRGILDGSPPDPARLPWIRRRSLWIGDFVTWIGFTLWFISGFAFPLWVWSIDGFKPGTKDVYYYYFFASQIVCGLIAASQMFFFTAFVSVRGFHPLLVAPEKTDAEEIDQLLKLNGRTAVYLGLAIVAPMLALLTLALADIPMHSKWPIGALALIGGAASWLAFKLKGTIDDDVSTLVAAMDPERVAAESAVDTVDSFRTGPR